MPIPTTAADVPRQTLATIAATRIRTAIFDGTFSPGERLTDSELQSWLGISRTPLREALHDLARVGLVEMIAQKETRVTTPKPDHRILVLQTLGALIGGVARVTVAALTDAQRRTILDAIDTVLETVAARDTQRHGITAWAMVDHFLDACPNPYLVRATHDTIDALAYHLAVTRTEGSTNWAALDIGYPAFKDAIHTNDPVGAELAIETVFQL